MKETEGFDDLIFSNRNRDYGAYMLRKRYNSVVLISLLAGIIIVSSLVVIPYLIIIGKSHKTAGSYGVRYVSVQMDKLDPPREEIILPPEVPPPPSGNQQIIRYVAPVIVDTLLPTMKQEPAVAELLDKPSASDNDDLAVSTSASENELMGDPSGEGGDEPFILVEVKPSFNGGDIEKFRQWVQKRITYPQEAQDNGIQGRVYLTFIVERDGSVSTVRIVRGVNKLLDDEAVKAIEASPRWSPGLQRGRPVRVRFSIFLNFTL